MIFFTTDGKFRCPWQGCVKLFASVFIVKKHLYRHIMSDPVIASNRQYPCGQCFMRFRLEKNHASHQDHHSEKSGQFFFFLCWTFVVNYKLLWWIINYICILTSFMSRDSLWADRHQLLWVLPDIILLSSSSHDWPYQHWLSIISHKCYQ